ncbi:MAG: hypothetical protein IT427_13075 [Pirellulales bacterium]|nr:hypothetical protein [Pirellulales bacterium]
MSLSFTPDDIPQVADPLVLIVLKTSGGTSLAADVRGFRRQMFWGDVANSAGAYTENDVFWHLARADFAFAPSVGQRIVEPDSTEWAILDVQIKAQNTRWRCAARKV